MRSARVSTQGGLEVPGSAPKPRTGKEPPAAGYRDAVKTLRHPGVLSRPDTPDGVATFDLT